jgi:uncharacterized membrane protein
LAISSKEFDHPVLLLFFVTLGVVGTIAVLSYLAQEFHLTGLLGLLKGGVAPAHKETTH